MLMPSDASSRATLWPGRPLQPPRSVHGVGWRLCRREPSAPSRIDEPDVADVRQLLLARVLDLDRHDGVPRRELHSGTRQSRRPRKSETTTASERCRQRTRASYDGGPDRGPPHALGLGPAPDGEQDREQPHAPPRGRCKRVVRAGCGDADAVAAPRGEVAQRHGDALGHVPLAAVRRAEATDGETSRATHDVSARSATSTLTCTVCDRAVASPVDPATSSPGSHHEAARARLHPERPSDAQRRAAQGQEPPIFRSSARSRASGSGPGPGTVGERSRMGRRRSCRTLHQVDLGAGIGLEDRIHDRVGANLGGERLVAEDDAGWCSASWRGRARPAAARTRGRERARVHGRRSSARSARAG